MLRPLLFVLNMKTRFHMPGWRLQEETSPLWKKSCQSIFLSAPPSASPQAWVSLVMQRAQAALLKQKRRNERRNICSSDPTSSQSRGDVLQLPLFTQKYRLWSTNWHKHAKNMNKYQSEMEHKYYYWCFFSEIIDEIQYCKKWIKKKPKQNLSSRAEMWAVNKTFGDLTLISWLQHLHFDPTVRLLAAWGEHIWSSSSTDWTKAPHRLRYLLINLLSNIQSASYTEARAACHVQPLKKLVWCP